MKKIFMALFVLLSFALPFAAQEKEKEPKPDALPRLSIESFTHDFGDVKSGSALSYSFKIKNKGKSDLIIRSVKPG